MTLKDCWEAHPDVLVTDLSDELVLLDPRRGEMYSVTGAGSAAWRALPGDLAHLTGAVTAAYDVDEARAREDLRTLLAELEARGLVRNCRTG
ncbi:PqqD family protein [Deinococcus murrayi]|uniref:PqqD family protein n=1 Tax=Deinococcus murrayi TaxID=68910 RepID=UPI00054CE16A|nr:PqqD family protein [Deinococcus murrayi]